MVLALENYMQNSKKKKKQSVTDVIVKGYGNGSRIAKEPKKMKLSVLDH